MCLKARARCTRCSVATCFILGVLLLSDYFSKLIFECLFMFWNNSWTNNHEGAQPSDYHSCTHDTVHFSLLENWSLSVCLCFGTTPEQVIMKAHSHLIITVVHMAAYMFLSLKIVLKMMHIANTHTWVVKETMEYWQATVAQTQSLITNIVYLWSFHMC